MHVNKSCTTNKLLMTTNWTLTCTHRLIVFSHHPLTKAYVQVSIDRSRAGLQLDELLSQCEHAAPLRYACLSIPQFALVFHY